MEAGFYIDPATESPHICNHQVNEDEVIDVLERPGEDRAGSRGFQNCLGPDGLRPILRIVYIPDPEPGSVFVITAYEMIGKPLAAYRKRRRKKRQ